MANPLLTAVTFEYPNNAVEEVTKDNFRLLFKGSEMVVAGKLRDQDSDVLSAKVSGQLVSVASHPGGEGWLEQAQASALLDSSRLTLSKLPSAPCHHG